LSHMFSNAYQGINKLNNYNVAYIFGKGNILASPLCKMFFFNLSGAPSCNLYGRVTPKIEKYKSDLSQTRLITWRRQAIFQGIFCNQVKTHSFPKTNTLKSLYFVQWFSICDALSTAGYLLVPSRKCPF
jgi:hypothetical protein